MKPKYGFDKLLNSPEDGFNDPLKTIFGEDVETVAREAFQNSIDAVADTSKPVKVRINLEIIKTNQIPEHKQLDQIFRACSEKKAGKKYYENAKKLLNSNQIPVLIISDFNTTGLTGSNTDENSKYYHFFKSVGNHDKPAGSAGSYGYGKATNIAFSAFDLFFATSVFKEQDTTQIVFMGCMRVCSFKVKGSKMRGIGSFGLAKQQPIRNKELIPKFFLQRKAELGTDIFIPGYKDSDDWKENTIKAALKNFWPAIHMGKLEVEVGDVYINAETLYRIMTTYFPKGSKLDKWKTKDPTPYYEAFLNGKKTVGKLPVLGNVECYLLSKNNESQTNHIACFRKNLMLIQHKRFDSIVPYSGVFICTDDKGNAILQKMEPPQHNKWDMTIRHAHNDDNSVIKECAAADKEYKFFLREEIGKLVSTRTEKRIFINSIDEYISLDNFDKVKSQVGNGPNGENPSDVDKGLELIRPLKIKERAVRNSSYKSTSIPGSKEKGNVIIDIPGGETEKIKKQIPINKTNPNEIGSSLGDSGTGEVNGKIAHARLRTFTVAQGANFKTILIARTIPKRPNTLLNLHIRAGTDDGLEAVEVNAVQPQGNIKPGGRIENVLTDDQGNLRLEITFAKNERYSLAANFYEIR